MVPLPQVNNDPALTLFGPQDDVHTQHFPTQDEELVQWATQKFGGVTSFTTVRNPKTIHSTGREGEDYLRNPGASAVMSDFEGAGENNAADAAVELEAVIFRSLGKNGGESAEITQRIKS